jgi:hypothetical protein
MSRRSVLLAVAVAMLATGIGLGAQGAGAQAFVQANPGGPYAARAGAAIQFDGTASSGIGLSYVWSFGDGTSAFGARPVKVYGGPGIYTVTLTVTDYLGNQSAASTTASIHHVSTIVPGCVLTIGGVICNQVVSPAFVQGCFLTLSGLVCPRSIVVGPFVIGGFAGVCANPNYAFTPFCQDLR